MDRTPPRRLLWLRAGLLLLSVLLALGGLEGAVRIRQWMRYGSPTGAAFELVPDPVTGLKIPKPRQDTGRVRINRLGFRGPELAEPKPPGTVRLAFLGGSTTFCAEVSGNEATWPDRICRALRELHPDVGFDYINAAVPGYSVDEMRITLERRVVRHRPDVVVLYEATNDLSADTRVLAKRAGLFQGEAEDPSPLARFSVAWYLVEKNLLVRQRQRGAASGRTLHYNADSLARSFGARLTELIRTARQVAPVCAVATFSHKMRRDQPPEVALANSNTALYYSPYQSVGGILDGFEAYNRALAEAARSTGAILIEGEYSIPADDRHFVDSVHFTDQGARAMAERVVRSLEASPEFRRVMELRTESALSTLVPRP